MTDYEYEEKNGSTFMDGAGVVAKTATGVGVGLIGAAIGVAALAAAEITLPAMLCLKAAGIVGGGVGLVFGVNSVQKRKNREQDAKDALEALFKK